MIDTNTLARDFGGSRTPFSAGRSWPSGVELEHAPAEKVQRLFGNTARLGKFGSRPRPSAGATRTNYRLSAKRGKFRNECRNFTQNRLM
jgi:hypothetical protein